MKAMGGGKDETGRYPPASTNLIADTEFSSLTVLENGFEYMVHTSPVLHASMTNGSSRYSKTSFSILS